MSVMKALFFSSKKSCAVTITRQRARKERKEPFVEKITLYFQTLMALAMRVASLSHFLGRSERSTGAIPLEMGYSGLIKKNS